MKKLLVVLCMLFFFFGIIGFANATLVDHGSYSSCDATGLDWMELEPTLGLHFTYVDTQFGPSGLFDGWRYATQDELETMITGMGGTPPYNGWSEVNNGVAIPIINQIGYEISIYDYRIGTYVTEMWAWGSLGTISPDSPSGEDWRLNAIMHDSDHGGLDRHLTGDYIVSYAGSDSPYGSSPPDRGSFLVRDTVVPIPGAVWLLGSGLIGIVGIRRKYKK